MSQVRIVLEAASSACDRGRRNSHRAPSSPGLTTSPPRGDLRSDLPGLVQRKRPFWRIAFHQLHDRRTTLSNSLGPGRRSYVCFGSEGGIKVSLHQVEPAAGPARALWRNSPAQRSLARRMHAEFLIVWRAEPALHGLYENSLTVVLADIFEHFAVLNPPGGPRLVDGPA